MKRPSSGGGVDGGSDGDELADVDGVADVEFVDLTNIFSRSDPSSSIISSSTTTASLPSFLRCIAIIVVYYDDALQVKLAAESFKELWTPSSPRPSEPF